MTIAEAMNTYNPALFLITKKGYEVSLVPDDDEGGVLGWKAQAKNIEVFAFTPLSLLALVVIADELGENWNRNDYGNLYEALLEP
jgi:hypothetical protein